MSVDSLLPLLALATAAGLIWLVYYRLKKPAPKSVSIAWVRLTFTRELPERMYGRDLIEAYLDARVAQISPLAAAQMDVLPGEVLWRRVRDVRADVVVQMLNHGIDTDELYVIGEVEEFDSGPLIVYPKFNAERTEVKVWMRPADIIPAGVVH